VKRSLTSQSLAALVLFAAISPIASAADGITEYQAIYEVTFGSFSGTGDFSVKAEESDTYVFSSAIKLRGLVARTLLGKDPALEGSRFVVAGGQIRPQRFWYEDGTRKGEDNFVIDFTAGGEIRASGPEVARTLPYEADLLDRGSLQVALMRDVAACRIPGPYRYVDDDGITTYEYEQLENQPAETGIGTLATVRFVQRREGSDNETVLWLSPDYAYVPVRIERFDGGELEWVFALDKLDGIERTGTGTGCSGFR
jgi:hypothetical protein